MLQFLLRIFRHPGILPVYPAILLVILYQDVFISREAIFTHDTINWYANFNYFVLTLARGSLPLWDPYSFSGAPFYLNHNIVGALDPTVLITIPLIRYFNISVLDVYHIHFLLRLFIFYVGAYVLFRYIARNNWAALIGATIVLFVMAPNSFWQHGSTLIVTYAPLIMLFLLQLVSQDTPYKWKGPFFIALCYLIGLSFNMYLPSYILIYLSLALIYLLVSKSLKVHHLRKAVSAVGIWKGVLGILVFFIMTGPFLFSVTNLMPETGENFSYTRFEELPTSDTIVHTAKLTVAKSSSTARATIHNLMGAFLPGPDARFFVSGDRPGMNEISITFGLIPLILVFLFFKRARSPYKGLFLFLMVVIGLYMFSPASWYYKVLQYYPGARTIRQLTNFLGFFILSWGALTAIGFAGAFNRVTGKDDAPTPSLNWVFLLATIHIWVFYRYLSYIRDFTMEGLFTSVFLVWTQQSILIHGRLFIVSYLLVAFFLLVRFQSLRFFIILTMAGLTLYQLVEFNKHLKHYVIQPGIETRTGHVHYDREFAYEPVRIPFVPRHTTFWGFLPALYRIPTAIPTYFNTYMTLNRRNFDFIRFTSAERQRIISGIGTKRFGFFDRFTVAKDSMHALDLVGRMPADMIHDTLVLEEDPMRIVPEEKVLERVEAESLAISETLVRGSHQHLVDFYDRVGQIDYKGQNAHKVDGYLRYLLPEDHPALDWPWDREHIGYFQVMFGPIGTSDYYRPMWYHPNPGIRTGYYENLFCYYDLKEWFVKHARPYFYSYAYYQYPYPCDIKLTGRELLISPELQGVFVTDDITGPERDSLIPGFSVVSLDPAKVIPERSPYGRDEPTEVIEFGPNKISFKIQNSKPGLFYYADSFAKDWQATVDGSPSHIFKAHFNYKAVFVPEGEHIVTMEFRPELYIFLMWGFIVFSIPGMALPVMALMYSKRLVQ